MTETKPALNLDELLTFKDKEPFTYEDDQPNAGIPQHIFSQDHFEGAQLAMFYKNHRGTDLYNTYSVGGWEEGNYHRIVQDGPRVNGPVAWMNENAVTLTAHKQTPREEILVEDGDHVILRGTEYVITKDRRGYVRLVKA
ncbi:hypothetical protein [Arthrobacter sp. zg-Y1110]|uniref:hypothetical protein n=1 Tax=Arthrobacter sp. zg-Y1110 TaxID=2886932 RepID=UPI001D143966|nr:hypothetical protein [Arthrobacter sp. zg-Y1110]MCC3292495.1 hypothetical protein [Arthrobacter sp. zg-Y1110]UWX87073.1 hypothetical protein N2K99_17120 [Arthrobacter sp. zg-Y1110]